MNYSSKLVMRNAFAELKREDRWNEAMKYRNSEAFLSRLLHRAKHFDAPVQSNPLQENSQQDLVALELEELIDGLRRMSVETSSQICEEEEAFIKQIRSLGFAHASSCKPKPSYPGSKQPDASGFTEVLQQYSTIEHFVDFNDGDWLVSLKPKGTRAMLVVLNSKSILFLKKDLTVPIDFNPFLTPGKPASQKGSIFDCYVNSCGPTSFVTIMDVLILEGKPMVDLPAEVRYYFMYNNLTPDLDFAFFQKDLAPEPEPPVSYTIHSSNALWVGIIGLVPFSAGSVKRLSLKAQQTMADGLILLNRQGEYKIHRSNEDAIYIPSISNKVHDYNASSISMRFDIKTQSFCSLEGDYSIEINSSDLRMDWSFSNEDDKDDDYLPSARSLLSDELMRDEPQSLLISPRCYWKNGESSKEIRLINGRIYSLLIDDSLKRSNPNPTTPNNRASSSDRCSIAHHLFTDKPAKQPTACSMTHKIGAVRYPEVTVAVLLQHLASKQV